MFAAMKVAPALGAVSNSLSTNKSASHRWRVPGDYSGERGRST
jgi:hypothetical protein